MKLSLEVVKNESKIIILLHFINDTLVIMVVSFGLVLSLLLSVNSWSVKYKAMLED